MWSSEREREREKGVVDRTLSEFRETCTTSSIYFTNDHKTIRSRLRGLSLKVLPLSLDGLLLEVLPAGSNVSSKNKYADWGIRLHLHLGLLHGLDQLQLALGDLDDLLDEASAELLLQLVDSSSEY